MGKFKKKKEDHITFGFTNGIEMAVIQNANDDVLEI